MSIQNNNYEKEMICMEYTIENLGDRFFIYDASNRFVSSADSMKEAREDIAELIRLSNQSVKKYFVNCLQVKSRWITKNGKAIQVAIGEPYHYSFTCTAKSEAEAISKLDTQKYLNYDIKAIQLV